MAKIKMKYKKIAKEVTKYLFSPNIKKNKQAQALQLFIEAIAIPAGMKEYTDELAEIYIMEVLVKADLAKQKDENQIKEINKKFHKQTQKFIKQQEKQKKIKKFLKIFKRK